MRCSLAQDSRQDPQNLSLNYVTIFSIYSRRCSSCSLKLEITATKLPSGEKIYIVIKCVDTRSSGESFVLSEENNASEIIYLSKFYDE